MKTLKKILLIILPLIICLFGIQILFAQNDHPQDATQPPCRDCHICKSPTTDHPCLTGCLIEKKSHKKRSPAEGPDVRILNQIQKSEPAVRFDHKAHAEMVGMGMVAEPAIITARWEIIHHVANVTKRNLQTRNI